MRPIADLTGQFVGQTLNVVGRGASLARLQFYHVGPGPVVAINQAIREVEALGLPNPVFSLQKDKFFEYPQVAPLLVHSYEALKSDAQKIADYGKVYVFDNPQDFGLAWDAPSAVVCVDLARLMGCSEVAYLACDSAFGGVDTWLHGQVVRPANCVDYLAHPRLVRARALELGMAVRWQQL